MVDKTAWSSGDTSNNTAWSRAGGIDTDVPTYDDPLVSYNDSSVFYDGYDATAITGDDVRFSTFTNSGTPANAAWTDIT